LVWGSPAQQSLGCPDRRPALYDRLNGGLAQSVAFDLVSLTIERRRKPQPRQGVDQFLINHDVPICFLSSGYPALRTSKPVGAGSWLIGSYITSIMVAI
jgi:hypothetical protein